MSNNNNLTPKEKLLLEQLEELTKICQRVSDRLSNAEAQLKNKDRELKVLRRDMIQLKEENQHHKEMLQTWRQRLETTLSTLPDAE